MGALSITRLDRYVFRQLLGALLLVTLGLVALIWLTQSLRFVELVVNRGLSFVVFLKLTGLLIPGLENWRHRALLEERLATFDDRAARLADDDRSNDPRLAGVGPEACVYCHYQ